MAPRSRRPGLAARRRALRPQRWDYPGDLPVVQRKDEIAGLLEQHQVVIVAGETGSGKSTQLPKIAMEIGRGIRGMIGHTQPRRIAARSIAERVSEELGVELGSVVGYQVRFADHSRPDSLIKVMTDGILLAELQRDRDLRRYDTLIIDEAHERSLTIDFILGYLRQLLPRRPDLKVIITSATIDVERLAEHFATEAGPAPVIRVEGRTYPVQVRYRPLLRPGPTAKDGSRTEVVVDQVTGIVDAVEELWTEDDDGGPADILVFCSGEREIRDAAEALSGLQLPNTVVLPLYGRLSAAEQHRIFRRTDEGRRIVVSTNVAETSLTVPRIRYVVDTGTARISRYSQRLKVQRLPIEPISRASADQRAGRCGRIADGIAVRLYSEEDYLQRPEFTDPEIQRTNLASVVLRMTALGLGQIEHFGFLDPPDSRQVSDAVRLLTELQAIDPTAPADQPSRRLTAYGRAIADLPVDPRLARMLTEAERNSALREVLVIVAGLSIQDPRERPAELRTQADQAHARFRNGTIGPATDSDFMAMLNLWRYLRRSQQELSGSAFRRLCQREHLHYLRVREWQDLHHQLRQSCRELGLTSHSTDAGEDAVHQSLLAGLLSLIGLRDADGRDYLGARGARFQLQPGSALARSKADWVMTAELVETSRLWARVNARTDPAWVERAAAHVVKRSYSEPQWSRRRGAAVAQERVTLYGLPLVAGRTVPLGRIDPEVARELFIRHALVEGDWDSRHDFVRANRALLSRLQEEEARVRRRDIVVDDDRLVAFFDELIPASVVSERHFDTWWSTTRRDRPRLLDYTEALLRSAGSSGVSDHDYPGTWTQGTHELQVTYQFSPGTAADGVTVHVPVEILNQITPVGFDWQVPGLRQDLVTAMIKALPKAVRRHFVPAPDRAAAALQSIDPDRRDRSGLAEEVVAQLRRTNPDVDVRAADIEWDRVPDHLRVTFSIERSHRAKGGRRRVEVVSSGKDLTALQAELRPQVQETIADTASVQASGLRHWSQVGTLAQTVQRRHASGHLVVGYPAVVDDGGSVSITVLTSEAEARVQTRRGVRRLLLLASSPPWKRVLPLLDNAQKMALGYAPHGSVPELLDDVQAAVVDAIILEPAVKSQTVQNGRTGGTDLSAVRDPAAFESLVRAVTAEMVPRCLNAVEQVVPVLRLAREVEQSADALTAPAAAPLVAQVRRGLSELIHPGFVSEAGVARLPHLVRYLRAMQERLTKGVENVARDADRAARVHQVREEYRAFLEGLAPHREHDPDVQEIGWQIRELEVSLFAQRLGTPSPVSEKRIYAAMDVIDGR